MSDDKKDVPVFTYAAKVRGGLNSNFVFETRNQYRKWLENGYLELQKKYSNLTVSGRSLPGLKIGDKCNVLGDADEIYEIVDLKHIGEHRYSFVLNTGLLEEVAKCHKMFV